MRSLFLIGVFALVSSLPAQAETYYKVIDVEAINLIRLDDQAGFYSPAEALDIEIHGRYKNEQDGVIRDFIFRKEFDKGQDIDPITEECVMTLNRLQKRRAANPLDPSFVVVQTKPAPEKSVLPYQVTFASCAAWEK